MASRITTRHGQTLVELTMVVTSVVLITMMTLHLAIILIEKFKHHYSEAPTSDFQANGSNIEVKFKKNLVFLKESSYRKNKNILEKSGWSKPTVEI